MKTTAWSVQSGAPAIVARTRASSLRTRALAAPAPQALAVADPWLDKALTALGNGKGASSSDAGRASALEVLKAIRVPTTRQEEYRFTDLAALVASEVCAAPTQDTGAVRAAVETLKLTDSYTAVLLDGVFRADLSDTAGLPQGSYIGPLSAAPAAAAAAYGSLSARRGAAAPFALLNGATAADPLVVHVAADASLEKPLHVITLSSAAPEGSPLPGSSPRVLVLAGPGSSLEIIEEFATLGSGRHFTNAVLEAALSDKASLRHRYACLEATGSFHLKATLVDQGQGSSYSLAEARLGGRLTRHDVLIDQLGEETHTELRHFLLAGEGQLHDLHSKLKLDFPHGKAAQLHKCIVSHPTGRGVFDGNVKVNRPAQKTDAQQLSRNLLLVPRATVNVKPNLQIIADDVKCTHGCAVSDLDDNELFYFSSRGIDKETARQALVYSFGIEVINHIESEALRKRIAGATADRLSTYKKGAAAAAAAGASDE